MNVDVEAAPVRPAEPEAVTVEEAVEREATRGEGEG